MTTIFGNVLQTSIYASIVAIVIIISKRLLKNKVNAKWQYLIWTVLLLKLLIPFGPESAVSFFNAVPKIQETTNFSKVYEEVQLEITTKQHNSLTISPSLMAQSKSLSIAATIETTLPYIWATGVLLLLLWLLFTYSSIHKKLRRSSLPANERILNIFEGCKDKMSLSKNIEILIQKVVGSPSLFGIINPKILLFPQVESFTDKEIEYILLHEIAHYKRKDVVVNYLLLTMQLVHWFNPLMWYCFKCIRQDMEVATDEKVLLTLEKKEYIAYGKVLIMVLEKISITRLAPKLIGMIDDKKNMKRRIKMLKNSEFSKSKGKMVFVVGLMCVLTLGGVMLTNGVTRKASGKDVTNYNSDTLFKSKTYNIETLFKFKTPYVGDNSKVSGIIDNLPYANLRKGFSLQTKETPYGITVNYDLSKDTIATKILEANLRNNAVIMFSLIDNVAVINFNIIGNNGEPKYEYTRDLLQKSFEKDLKEYSKDIKSFETFINNYTLRLFAYPEKYTPTMSSTPGIKITAEYPGLVDKVRYSTNSGTFLNWEIVTGKTDEKGSLVEAPYDMPIYWSPVNNKSDNIFVKVEILDKNNKVLEEKQVNIKWDKEMLYTVQASSDVVIGEISKK